MMKKEDIGRLMSLVLIASVLIMLAVATGSCQGTRTVGVKAGDWVKYNLISFGTPEQWEVLYDKAVWIKVEVQDISGTTVTARETRHLQDGTDMVETISWDLQGSDTAPIHFIPPIIISANLGPGDVVEQCDVWITYGNWVNVELTLNDTALRSYGGVTREVNVLEFSQCLPYSPYIANLTHKCYWDKETGFLLERIDQRTFLDHGETSVSNKVELEIADTNMWEMKTDQPFWRQSWMWAVVGLVGTTTAGATIIAKKKKQNKRE